MGVSFTLDRLGSLFTAIIAVVTICVSIFAFGYRGRGLSSRAAGTTMPLFAVAMMLLPAAATVSTFLIIWEMMAITSLFLVLADHVNRVEVRSAGHWYGVMTQLGAALILIGLLLLASHAGSQSFSVIRSHTRWLSPDVRSGSFILLALGFGSKAGAVPLHVWLPRAHPEAPSPISALMSAGMVNLGIYGIVRVGMWMLPGGPTWWWVAIGLMGAASAFFGSVHSATETDLKRLLAYSTTDNMGLVLLGVGASGIFASLGNRALAQVALAAALLHVIFHAAIKASLFMAVGSIQKSTGTKDLDRLGGLLTSMPITGTLFLIGGSAISALPPLSGFVSEWLLLQTFLHGAIASNAYLAVAMPIGVAVLALTGGLTAVTFVKAIGTALLGRARSPSAELAPEVSPFMWLPSSLLSLATVVFGVAPIFVIRLVIPSVEATTGWSIRSPLDSGWRLGLVGIHGDVLPAAFAIGLAIAFVVVAIGRQALQKGEVRATDPWGCGREIQTPRMQYTATSFSEPLLRVFDDVLRPDHDLDVSHAAESRFYVESIEFRTEREDVFERRAFRPADYLLNCWGDFARQIQNGSIHRYLAFGFIALITVLVVVS